MGRDATTTRGKRRKRYTAAIRATILERVESRGLSLLEVARLSGVPRTVVRDFLGTPNRDIGLSHAERIWTAVGIELKAPRKVNGKR